MQTIDPVHMIVPQYVNLQGLSRGMERYNKSTILSAGVRALTFSIGDYFFCLVVLILSKNL